MGYYFERKYACEALYNLICRDEERSFMWVLRKIERKSNSNFDVTQPWPLHRFKGSETSAKTKGAMQCVQKFG